MTAERKSLDKVAEDMPLMYRERRLQFARSLLDIPAEHHGPTPFLHVAIARALAQIPAASIS